MAPAGSRMKEFARRAWDLNIAGATTASCARSSLPAIMQAAARLILGLVAFSCAATAAGTWVAEYPRVAAAADRNCTERHLTACRRELMRLYRLLDARVDVLYRLAEVEARLHHDQASFKYLQTYAQSQLDFGDPARESTFTALRSVPGFQAMAARYRAGLQPVAVHDSLAVLPDADLVAEDLTVDPRDGARYVSSVHASRVLRLTTDGNWQQFFLAGEHDAWGVYALAIDAARDRLWLGTVANVVSPPYRASDHGRSALLRIGLRTGNVEQRFELADGAPHAFGDLAVGPNGEVYVSDGVGGGVYRVGAEPGATLNMLVAPGALRSPQTPVPLPNGTQLLVADYSRGIAVIDLLHGSVSWLPHPPELALHGIDGLYLRDHTLIAVQNGTTPERLLLIRLDAAWSRATGWEVALARAPGLGDPTHGVVRGDQFEFISNSGWDRLTNDGSFDAKKTASNAEIWRISLPN